MDLNNRKKIHDMAIKLKLKGISANNLISQIMDYINTGKLRTWEYDIEGDFTHSAPQWKNEAWIRHNYITDSNAEWDVIFGLLGKKTEEMTKSLYAIYHGRFSEMLLTYFDNYIVKFEITSAKDEYDSF